MVYCNLCLFFKNWWSFVILIARFVRWEMILCISFFFVLNFFQRFYFLTNRWGGTVCHLLDDERCQICNSNTDLLEFSSKAIADISLDFVDDVGICSVFLEHTPDLINNDSCKDGRGVRNGQKNKVMTKRLNWRILKFLQGKKKNG